ncbi:MAG: hypothetical protein L0332_20175 [Chloroflexi bacterium]|nr:hypothetical protein [Chloroflexota bacterium]MCI0576997.1 hypothetical protein [Chloroflexota bacterium]MCI0647782.1 hypothetical protein [Chloroflexota bacterium]MCI0729016.1 hypothetical protein [Chloroflexota bacterium]
MDVNGTRFHLLKGKQDWTGCREVGQAEGWRLAAWDDSTETAILSPLLSIFPRGRRDAPLDPSARRGAAVDRFGNWYWISQERQRIYWLPSGSGRPQVYWEQRVAVAQQTGGAFAPTEPPRPAEEELAGLAVTTHHYLVAGNVTKGGLYLFDLHAGGAPTLLLFPPDVPFVPFDMAPAPGGGVWILDRVHHVYWGLDRNFNVVGEPAFLSPPEETPGPTFEPGFCPEGEGAVVQPGRAFPYGFPLAAGDPISIEALPDNSVLILNSPAPAAGPSELYHYRLADQLAPPLPLAGEVEVTVIGETTTSHHLSVAGHDMAYTAHNQMLYVVERDGNQVIAFRLDPFASPPTLDLQRAYLPLHFFGGRALVASAADGSPPTVYYDVAGRRENDDAAVRWAPLHALDQPRYTRQATLLTPVFDGKERDCVWHRLLLDACIPPETAVAVWTRANNERALLESVAFRPEPDLYLRGDGAEIPYYEPFSASTTPPEGQGTWELLFQEAHGRYLQLRLELQGNGRVTPRLHALRAYYPRFSYPDRYMPAIYQEEGSFLERLLANMEGIYTRIEGQMADVSVLFDGRSAPPEALDWLAGWLGLMLDPLWSQVQAGRPVQTRLKWPPDRRRLFIRYARKLYERRGTLDGIRFALHLFLDPCLEATLRTFKQAAITPSSTLPQQLARFELLPPTPVMSEAALEDLLYDYVLRRPSKIRLVERFQTRGGRALVAGDPTQAGALESAANAIQASAHRFTVLIPEGLPPAEEAMVQRIVNLEKPAHTAFQVRRYWDGFRAGEARLGIDTTLGESGRFVPVIVGRDYLAEGYLPAAHPFNVRERFVSDRDTLGHLPPL